MEKIKISVSQFGRRNNFIAAKVFERHGLLEAIYTTYWDKGDIVSSAISKMFKGASKYKSDIIPTHKVKVNYLASILGKALLNIRKDVKDFNFETPETISYFNHWVATNLSNYQGIVYSLSDSQSLFNQLDKNCIKIHEQVNCAHAYYDALLRLEISTEKQLKRFRRGLETEKEWMATSDYFISPSAWITDNLAGLGVDPKKIFHVPYVVPDWCINYWKPRTLKKGDKINLVFVGRIHEIKGVLNIIKLANKFKDNIEITLVGNNQLSKQFTKYPNNIKIIPFVDHSKLINIYLSSHLFLLPSYCEGSALVSYEAMGTGLPGLVSYQSGSKYIDKLTGRIFDAYNISNLYDIVELILDDPKLIDNWSENTFIEAKKLTFDNYDRNLMDAIHRILHIQRQ